MLRVHAVAGPWSRPFPFLSIVVAQNASVGVWSPSLQFQQGFVACEEDVAAASSLYTAGGGGGRRNKVMVTDCVLMENCSKLVLAVTKRELQFHDVPSGSNSGQTLRIKVFGTSVYVLYCNSVWIGVLSSSFLVTHYTSVIQFMHRISF